MGKPSNFKSRNRPLTLKNTVCFVIAAAGIWYIWKSWSESSFLTETIVTDNQKALGPVEERPIDNSRNDAHHSGSGISDEISLPSKETHTKKGCDPKSHLCLSDGTILPAKGLFAHGDSFYLDGKPFQILSGSLHYFRIHPVSWGDRLLKMRAAGLNTVATYIPWNLHEPVNGTIDFTGNWDLAAFILTVHQVGLKLIIRPGPYICAEWDFGGLPPWLLRDINMKVRSSYKPYLTYVERYFDKLLPLLAPWQYSTGKGPIIAFQIENEFGSFNSVRNESGYFKHLLNLYKKWNINELFFTSDGAKYFQNGAIEGVLETANFHFNVSQNLKKLKAFQPNKPLMVAEYWDGWFDHWSEIHHAYDTVELNRDLATMLNAGASVNFYMFAGGTNWGFWNGANNLNDFPYYSPTTTSYDYDAPVSESGELKPKYHVIRKIIRDLHLGPHDWAPVPPNPISTAYKTVTMRKSMSYLEMIRYIEKEKHLMLRDLTPMEMLNINNDSGQSYGWLLYRTVFSGGRMLTISAVARDRAQIIINGVLVKTFNLTDANVTVKLENLSSNNQLDILVENLGHANYKWGLDKERKGLLGSVLIDQKKLENWEHIPIEFTKAFCNVIRNSEPFKAFESHKIPALYKGTIELISSPTDTYLVMEMWTKGIVLVNGFNLGRYWNIGPQQTLYVPAGVLIKGVNEVIVFDLHGGQPKVTFSDKHIWRTIIV